MATDLNTPTAEQALGDAVMDLARRFGRRGVNEAAVWTLLRADVPGLPVEACTSAVQRLIADGRLYRSRRRTRTMLYASADAHPGAAEPTADRQVSLFDDDETQPTP